MDSGQLDEFKIRVRLKKGERVIDEQYFHTFYLQNKATKKSFGFEFDSIDTEISPDEGANIKTISANEVLLTYDNGDEMKITIDSSLNLSDKLSKDSNYGDDAGNAVNAFKISCQNPTKDNKKCQTHYFTNYGGEFSNNIVYRESIKVYDKDGKFLGDKTDDSSSPYDIDSYSHNQLTFDYQLTPSPYIKSELESDYNKDMTFRFVFYDEYDNFSLSKYFAIKIKYRFIGL
jgi:hypothetical protein